MATAAKKCRVCGKSYEACHTMSKTAGVFRWQEVACSPECGAEYLRLIMESRNPTPPAPKHRGKRRAAPLIEKAVQKAGPVVELKADEAIEAPVDDE